jgi:hypothetical protein
MTPPSLVSTQVWPMPVEIATIAGVTGGDDAVGDGVADSKDAAGGPLLLRQLAG